ncbi:MAG: peptidoglycan-binding protein, partial [Pyrinomonadaceae bacterium]|nr:peptidoglycan-binding protein [Pyrinomonadaceae bacterium]
MKLQGRDLSASMQGPDVALLQLELRRLGFTIPPEEFRAKTFGDATQKAVRNFQAAHRLEPTGVVNQHTAVVINAAVVAMKMPSPALPQPKLPDFIVNGHISQADGGVLVGVMVRAFDKDMRSEKLLSEVITDQDGRYEITYSAAQFVRAEKKSADLIVRVFDDQGALQLASPLIFNAQPVETVDLTLDGSASKAESEYERLVKDVLPVMPGVALEELSADEIKFLGGQTGNDPLHILFLVLATRRASKIDVPAAAFYGFFRQDLPTRLEALMLQKPVRLRLALETSLQQNLIPAAIGNQIDDILAELERPDNLFKTGDPVTTPVLGVLSTSTLSPERQAKFVISAARHDGSTEEFWQNLRRDPDFGAEQVKELQLTMQLGLLAQNHVPLVRELQKRKPSNEMTSLRDLAGMEESDWLAMVQRPDVGVPDDVPGANADEKSKNYVSGIVQLMEAAFPSATAAAKLIKENRADDGDVIKFFSKHHDFDFASSRIDDYLSRNEESAFKDVTDGKGLTKQLKSMQRVFHVAPRYDHMRALMEKGLDSARAISNVSKESFLEEFGAALGGAAQAEYYYSKAGQVSETSTMVATTVTQSVNDIMPMVIAKPPDSIKTSPNFSSLFGSSSLCDCDHCSSVYSPAAYLVDVLQFLNPDAGEKPLDSLLKRRPDIEHIQLSCENTETPLPYIDLVNEVMEYYIAHNGQLDASLAKDTVDITAEELSVNPQYINNQAYNILKQSIYPLTMPFHRSMEVARLYLEHLGSSRYEVMKTFQGDGAPSDEAIANEYLKISAKEQDILTGDTTQELSEFYGYSSDPANPSWRENWRNHLAHVSKFLAKTGINYADLTELLKTRFINADHSVTLDPDVTSPCDLSKMKIEPLTVPVLNRMHRFIRLWRKLGWTIEELDHAIFALQPGKINAHLLQNLSLVKQLEADLNLALDSMLSLWSNIETTGDNPLYYRLFLNRTVLNPPDGAFTQDPSDPSKVIGDGQSDLTLSAHVSALLAALRISASDLDLIRVELKLAADDAPLNLENLSALYRYSVLAKALRLKVGDVISLKTLSGTGPFESPHQCKVFAETAQKVQQSGFSVAQLDYLYRHLAPTPNNFAPRTAQLLIVAKTLRDGLTQIATDNEIAEDSSGDFTRVKLATIFESAVVDQVIQMVNGSAVYRAPLANMPAQITFPPDSVKKKASYNAQTKMLSFLGPMTTEEEGDLLNASANVKYRKAIKVLFQQPRDLIANTLTGFLDPAEAVTHLLETPSLTPKGKPHLNVIARKFSYVLKGLLPYLRDQLSRSLIKQTLSDELELANDMTALLLETSEILSSRAHSHQAAIKDFMALRTQGLAGTYFNADNLTGASTARIDATLGFDGEESALETTLPSGTGSVRWTGLLLAPNNDSYTLTVRTNGVVRLWLGDDPQPVIDAQQHTSATELSGGPVPLKAGQLYKLQLEVTRLNSPAIVKLSWSGATTPKDLIPSANLYPANVFDNFTASFTLLQKIGLLVNGFKLSADEVAYLSSHGSDFSHLSLAKLPLDHTGEVDQHAPILFRQWLRLNNFGKLRNGLPQNETSLTEVFATTPSGVAALAVLSPGSTGALVIALQRLLNIAGAQPVLPVDAVFDSRTTTAVMEFQQSHGLTVDGIVGTPTWRALKAEAPPNLWHKVTARVATEEELVNVFGWDAVALDLLLVKLNLEPDDFKNEIELVRLQTCMDLSKRLGVSANQLFHWATSEPDVNQANEITKTVKAKYDDAAWVDVGKALNDGLRVRRRDALLAYVLTEPNIVEQGITNSNQLFEYFLIDVDMDCCMMTSRIKQAISSVQLFIQRCLMNLESEVKPSAIDDDQWEWMKNYRVWEANRKVFLYPENWIEPELRDDKSPFFKELETQLLQNDITAVTAEDAFVSYLEKLHAVARLEICGMYTETDTENDAITILHVFGRTHQIPHIYYYRQLAGGVWTPWEKVDMDIEGDHLIPVVYNRRLYLFWPHFEEKPDSNQDLGVPYIESSEHVRWS